MASKVFLSCRFNTVSRANVIATRRLLLSRYWSSGTTMASENNHPTQRALKVLINDDPQQYTAGRWLRNDEVERASRTIKFNFNELCSRVIALCPGAKTVQSWEKKEGGYNRVFIFTLDNAQRVVARLPTGIAGPAVLTTNSEVATIKYLQTYTTVAVPQILGWSDNASNPVGTEYIIMECVHGQQLGKIWDTMSPPDRIACTTAIVQNVEQMANLQFATYGSLYFDTVNIDSGLKKPVSPGFVIGPHCGATYWDCDIRQRRYYTQSKPNRGPCRTQALCSEYNKLIARVGLNLPEYTEALIDLGLSRIPNINAEWNGRPTYEGSIQEHIRILKAGRKLISELLRGPAIYKASSPVLLHHDLNTRNIFVSEDDPTVVTGIIDWQSSSILPAFTYADHEPDFATNPIQNEDQPDEQDWTNLVNECRKIYYAGLRALAPRLWSGLELDSDISRLLEYCPRTYHDGAGIFRQILLDVEARWDDLSGSTSFPSSALGPISKQTHEDEYRALVNIQEIRHWIAARVGAATDGWVPAEDWENAKARHKGVFDEFVESTGEEDVKEMWPFDLPEVLERK